MNAALIVLIYVIASFLALLQALLLWMMVRGEIPLKDLLSDGEGQASLSRFQFMLFTFVIAVGILYLTIKCETFPELDHGVLLLLGISGASYAIGKSLDNQANDETSTEKVTIQTEAKKS
jgi:hypothetical protein